MWTLLFEIWKALVETFDGLFWDFIILGQFKNYAKQSHN